MDNWVFGDSIIVSFTESGPVLSEEKSAMRAYEAAVCISDLSGKLILYSNGVDVWNSEHLELSGSDGISSVWLDTGSPTTGGLLIIPAIGDTAQAYFWLLAIDFLDRKLRLSEINLSLDSGLGGITSDKKNIVIIDEALSDQLMAIRHGNGVDWWIIGRLGYPNSSSYCTILLTKEGIASEIFNIWNTGFTAGPQGEIAVSSDGSLLAFASGKKSSPAILSLHYFNRCDGSLNLIDTLLFPDANKGLYGLSFSGAGNFLYCSTYSHGKDIIYQIGAHDSSLTSFELMRLNSPGTSAIGNTNGQFELGPNGKIYFTRRLVAGLPGISSYAENLGVIHFPEEYGAACQLDTFGFYLGGYVNHNTYSLPNFPNYDLGPLVGSPCDTLSPPDTTQTSIPVFTYPSPTFNVFPSVSDGVFQVTSSILGTIQIMDLYGREWLEERIRERMSFDLNGAPRGIYIVVLMDEGGTFIDSRKVILE